MTTRLIMTKGLPGSGKSTWAKKTVADTTPGTMVRVNKDDLRGMLHDSQWSRTNEKRVLQARDGLVSAFLAQGISVIVDDTNLAPQHEDRLRKLAQDHKATFKVADMTDVPLHTCIQRDLERTRSVGKDVIEGMYKKYLAPPPAEAPPYIEGALDTILVDIDGTLARMVNRGPFEWDKVGRDEPIKNVVDLVNTLFWNSTGEIIFMSGRDMSCYPQTRAWLREHVGEWTRDCNLYMRKERDMRKDRLVKYELYRDYVEGQYNVRFVLDDRNQVVDMWRSLGLTCLQVAPGDF